MEDTAPNLTNIETKSTLRYRAAKVRGEQSKAHPKGRGKTSRRPTSTLGWLRTGPMAVAKSDKMDMVQPSINKKMWCSKTIEAQEIPQTETIIWHIRWNNSRSIVSMRRPLTALNKSNIKLLTSSPILTIRQFIIKIKCFRTLIITNLRIRYKLKII